MKEKHESQIFYTGLDLVPLPFESSQSYRSRFAWQQGFNERELRARIKSAFSIAVQGKSISAVHPIGELLYITGWQPADDGEGHFEWCRDHSILNQYPTKFRYCPVCLEGLYHSYLFQWVELQSCPIHQCELTTSCSSCGVHIGIEHYTIGTAYYRCSTCNREIAGVELSLTDHIELRENVRLLESRFASIFQEFKARFENAQEFHRFRSGNWDGLNSRFFDWCRPELPRRAANYLQHQQTRCCLTIEGITLLRWNQKWSNTLNSALSLRDPNLGNFHGVYQATLRRCREFAFGRKQACALEEELMQKLVSDHQIRRNEWDVIKLAFVLFRYGAEYYMWPTAALHELETVSGIFGLFSQVTYARRLRLAQRAWMLTIFAVILSYVNIESNWRDGVLLIAGGFPTSCAPFTSNASATDKNSSGLAWFPNVPGLSLWPFVRVGKPLRGV